MEQKKEVIKEFGLSSLSLNNRKTVFLISAIIFLGGLMAYTSMPKEYFPELQVPEIYVSTPYPGGNADFVRDNITEPVESEINGIKGVDEISSTSTDGFSMIKVKFDFSVTPDEALRKVKDKYDIARSDRDFPQLQIEPQFLQMDVSDMPILNINLSSKVYTANQLESYGKILKKKIKALPEVQDVVIRGVPEKKVIIELNRIAMASKNVSFNDIENSIKAKNVNLPSGDILFGNRKVTIKIDEEFKHWSSMDSVIIKAENYDEEIYLKDVVDTIYFGDADATSFARQYDETVVMLDVKKRSGENLLDATDKIKEIVEAREGLPNEVQITITNEQANKTKDGVSNLENSIIFGVILVVLVLLFFLGLRNALFVGIAIPLSMFLSFFILNTLGVTLNVMVLFSLVLALGMLVDNGIVVVENIYRLMDEGYSPMRAAKLGVGEVAWPIIASTATTLAAFVPLAFWPGIMGEFMKYLPITLIIVLGSSLFVALVINPVFTAVYMKIKEATPKTTRNFWLWPVVLLLIGTLLSVIGAGILGLIPLVIGLIMFLGRFLFVSDETPVSSILLPSILTIGIGIIALAMKSIGLANTMFISGGLVLINRLVFIPGSYVFQNKFLPRLENGYEKFLQFALHKHPGKFLGGTFLLLILSGMLIAIVPPNILFFPENQPNYLNIYIEHPVGTDIHTTNKTTAQVYEIVNATLKEKGYDKKFNIVYDVDTAGNTTETKEYLIKSVISQVGKGTSDPQAGPELGDSPHKARITVQFAEFQHRKGILTSDIKDEVDAALAGKFPAGVRVIVDKNQDGPPQMPPVNIEVTGPGSYAKKIEYADSIRKFLQARAPEYMQTLRLDVETNKLELPIELDDKLINSLGSNAYSVANTIRTSLFGKDISTYKEGEDNYDINIRLSDEERNDINALLNQEIVFRNTRGRIVNIPVRSLVKSQNTTVYSTYGSVVRKDLEDMVTVYAKTTKEDQNQAIIDSLKTLMTEFEKTPIGKEMAASGFKYKFTGQQEEMAKEMAFLSTALGVAVFLILLIIVGQFNSYSTPSIILTAVVLSLIGVLLGLVIFRQDFVIMMTMIGIISLAGVVVNNAIVLIDYTNLIRKRKREEQGLSETEHLSMNELIASIVEGGKTRLRPVLLTALTTVLGLIPLATGLNINFVKLFTQYNPEIFVGGDNVMFFGPMSWTIIYGLTFATFLTLVIVPVTYLLLFKFKVWLYKTGGWELKSNIK